MSTLVSTDPKPRRRRKRGSDRWLSEVKGIVALLAAGFGLVALATFDPLLTPAEQQGPTGPVGVWLGWASFQSFGYASLLLPLLLGAWGASAFLRPDSFCAVGRHQDAALLSLTDLYFWGCRYLEYKYSNCPRKSSQPAQISSNRFTIPKNLKLPAR